MQKLFYEIGCRECFFSDDVKHHYVVKNGDPNLFKNITEYQVMKSIEGWRERDGYQCERCESTNIEVLNVSSEHYRIYDSQRIMRRCQDEDQYMYSFGIDKVNGISKVKNNFFPKFYSDFLRAAVSLVEETIHDRPPSHFQAKNNGYFFICIASYPLNNDDTEVKVEKLGSIGITVDEILDSLNKCFSGTSIIVEKGIQKQEQIKLDFVFQSCDHVRYENDIQTSGPHGGANRIVKVEPNITGGDGYSVSIYNKDGVHPFWGDNIQMGHKQMEIINQLTNRIELRGFGKDTTGNSFSDYGLTILFSGGEPYRCILHMFDRGVSIDYY